MAYSKGGKIQAEDLNTLINNVNSVLGDLGQSTLSTITQYSKMTFGQWKAVLDSMSNLGNQQGTVLSSIASPYTGQASSYVAALITNKNAIESNRRNAAALGTFVYNGTEVTAGWNNFVKFTQSIAFTNQAAAINYFNAGGQIGLQFVHPASGTGIDGVFNGLATNCGTVVMSGQNTGTRSIAGTTYNGITKIPPSLPAPGNSPTIGTNLGYAGLTTNGQSLFKQIGATYVNPSFGGGTYSQNFIEVVAYTTNNGATVNFETTWDEIPNGLLTGAGSYTGPDAVNRSRTTTYIVQRPPSTTYITKSWGTLVFTGTVTGS